MYGMDDDKVRTKSVTKNGITKEMKVIQAENGFVVCITTSYMEKKEGEEEGEYKVEKKYWISKKDPMNEKKSKKEKEPQTVAQAIKNINL